MTEGKNLWCVVSVGLEFPKHPCILAGFPALEDALEYAAFVTEYDEDVFVGWVTYVVEGSYFLGL